MGYHGKRRTRQKKTLFWLYMLITQKQSRWPTFSNDIMLSFSDFFSLYYIYFYIKDPNSVIQSGSKDKGSNLFKLLWSSHLTVQIMCQSTPAVAIPPPAKVEHLFTLPGSGTGCFSTLEYLITLCFWPHRFVTSLQWWACPQDKKEVIMRWLFHKKKHD